MQQINDGAIVNRLYNDTEHGIIVWINATSEARSLYPYCDISRAFKTSAGAARSDFIVIEHIIMRYNPDFEDHYKEPDYFIAYVADGVIGHEIFEKGFPFSIEIRPLLNIAARQASNADSILGSFLSRDRPYDD
jgi:hypothetical protein